MDKAHYRAKNKKNTSDLSCSICNTWLEHWEKHHGKATVCSALNCSETKLVGAHIQRIHVDGAFIPARYEHLATLIIPFCQKHNQTEDEIILKSDTAFVDACPCK